ncbi:unnamed protein product [Nyctereutes procyonoides]|uniref:Cytochrome c oxidase assembly protein COX20, mitochondrial n=1 Tax=Nyctereutes procyonoides TaxID=34880 RepID=A0A811ZJI3_NYCPR|nr:unnamed protein product [Nyctereutes procyonoides]
MAVALEPTESSKGMPFEVLRILDVKNIPCAWDWISSGSLGYVVAGLGHFWLTSRIRRSCDDADPIVYKYVKLRIQERIAREEIKNKILHESTHLDPERKQTNDNSSN